MWILITFLAASVAISSSEVTPPKPGDADYKTPKQKRLEKEFNGFLEVEKQLIDSINNYVDLEKKRLDRLKSLSLAEKSEELKLDYIYNPVNVFKLIKRLVYSDVFAGMHENSAEAVVGGFKDGLPTEENLKKAAVEVFRWQDKNEAKVKDLANGDLPDKKSIKPLSIDDCFHLGRMAYNEEDYFHAAMWMEEAWERILLKKTATNKEKVPILDYLSFCYYKMGNIQRAYHMTKFQILEMDPENTRASSNLGYYKEEMVEAKMKFPEKDTELPPIVWMASKDIKKAQNIKDKAWQEQQAKEKKSKEGLKKPDDKKEKGPKSEL